MDPSTVLPDKWWWSANPWDPSDQAQLLTAAATSDYVLGKVAKAPHLDWGYLYWRGGYVPPLPSHCATVPPASTALLYTSLQCHAHTQPDAFCCQGLVSNVRLH